MIDLGSFTPSAPKNFEKTDAQPPLHPWMKGTTIAMTLIIGLIGLIVVFAIATLWWAGA